MSNGDRLPLLLFREPVPAKKQPGNGRGPKFGPRSRSEVSLAPRRRTSSALVLTGGCVLGLIAALRGVS